MAEGSPLGSCVSLIFLAMGIASLVYTVRIYNNSKDDPLKSITIKDVYTMTTVTNLNEKKCKCGEEIVNDFCSEEQLLSGCVDITSNLLNNKKEFLRYLKEELTCKDYKQKLDSFSQDTYLSQVFDLKLEPVHKMALGILIVIIINFGIVVLIFIAACGTICCGQCAFAILLPFLPCILIAGIFSGVVNLVLFIILCVQYKNGQVDEFVEFLKCSFVNSLQDFESIKTLKASYTPFMVINIIFIVLGCLTSGTNSKKKE